jgi:hypothetical protein
MNPRVAYVAFAVLAVSACDHPMLHQDRPGGSDYRGYQPSYQESPPRYDAPPGQVPAYEPSVSSEGTASSEGYDRARERQLWSRCDRGDAQACAARRFQP